MGFDEVMKYVEEELKEALLTVGNWVSEPLAWFDGVFPPDTRDEKIKHWFHVALPYLMVAVVLTVVVCILPCCCRCFGTCFSYCCSLCCRGGRLVKMMKAPGRNFRMPRRDFEIDPKGYFQNLRSHPGDKFC